MKLLKLENRGNEEIAMKKLGVFIFGVIVGAGIGLLTAPKTGEETREEVLNLAKDYWGQAQVLKDRVAGVADQGVEDVFARHDGDVQEKIDAARKIIADQVAKNAAVAHETLQKSVPIAAEKIANAAAVAHSAAENLADRIAPSGDANDKEIDEADQSLSPIDTAIENVTYPE